MRFINVYIILMIFFVAVAGPVGGAETASGERVLPTHAEAAVILAKYSGLFDKYVERDADVNACVSFFNTYGVYFGLMEVVNGSEFTKLDCARVMGQIELVLSGEATYLAGKVILPKGVDSWTDFCIMNDVQYVRGYQLIVGVLGAVREIK